MADVPELPDVTGLDVSVTTTAQASATLLAQVHALLLEAFDDGGFDDADWDHSCGGWHVVVSDGGVPVCHAAVVPRALEVGGRTVNAGYVEGVGTAPSHQGQGLGSVAMRELATVIVREFEMAAGSTDVHGFYERLGWERWQGPSFVRHGTELVRTADEDDGIMVLRFGPTAEVDLGAPIVCQARTGDDW